MKESYYERSLKKKEKRIKQVRRNKAILIITLSFIAVILICLSFNSISTEASDPDHKPVFKYYKSLEVKQGDTLWSIAQEYKNDQCTVYEYVSEVRKINSLPSDQIKSGNCIIVPYYSTEFLTAQN